MWLIAPGPPESSLAAWEDQQTQADWQDGAEHDGTGTPPSPGRSGARWGRQGGAGESPKTPVTPVRVAVLDRLYRDGGRLDASGREMWCVVLGRYGDWSYVRCDVHGEVLFLGGGWMFAMRFWGELKYSGCVVAHSDVSAVWLTSFLPNAFFDSR